MRAFRHAAPVVLFVFALSFLLACGGRSLSKKTARSLISELDQASFDKEEIYIESVNQTGARSAVVEATLKAGFRFEKVGDRWVIREVRLGQRPWEKIEDILAALNRIKTDETRKNLEQVAQALERYKAKNGSLPAFDDFVKLADQLTPDYLTPLIREDAWHHPLSAFRIGEATVRIISAGPDGKLGSSDDIEITRTFPR